MRAPDDSTTIVAYCAEDAMWMTFHAHPLPIIPDTMVVATLAAFSNVNVYVAW